MANNELNIILKLVDEASGKAKQITGDVTRQVNEVGNKTADATVKMKGFGEQLKESSKGLRDLRQTAFLATAALAIVIGSVREASKYNKESKETFDNFKIAIQSFSVMLGQVLRPALDAIIPVVKFLQDTVEAAIGGFIKAVSFNAEFFANLGQGPVAAYKRAVEVANEATDSFLNKIEQTRLAVANDMTLDNIAKRQVNLDKIIISSTKKMKAGWDAAAGALGNLGTALSSAEELGRGFAKAGAAVAIGMAIINTAQGITAALSGPPNGPPWPVNIAMAAMVAATGAIQIATIAAQKFHEGGIIRAHNGLAIDEVPIIAQTGEGILSRLGMSALGGSSNLNRLNNGISASGGGDINISIYGPEMSSSLGIERTAEMLGYEIERKLRSARSLA